METRATAACALLCALPLACQVTRTTRLAGPPVALATRTDPERAWLLVEGGERRGVVVRFVDPERPDDPAKHYYSVRNPWQQELGVLDAQGRAWRFRPHQREARWIVTGTVLEGARAILAAGPGAELVEVSLDELRARPATE